MNLRNGLAVAILGGLGATLAGAHALTPAERPLAGLSAPAALSIAHRFSPTVCPGPSAASGGGAGSLRAVMASSALEANAEPAAARFGAAALSPSAAQANAVPSPELTPLVPGRPVVRNLDVLGLGVIGLDPGIDTAGHAVMGSAVQSTLAIDGDLRGLSATGCRPAAIDQWLLGAGTVGQHRARLVLANPTSTTSVADVLIYGAQGRVVAPSILNVVVAPGQAKVIQLDALAPGQPQLAVRVRAGTGRLSAMIQTSALRGLVAGGTDLVVPSEPPAKLAVVPGVALTTSGGAPDAEDSPLANLVSIFVPGRSDAIVRVSLSSASGEQELGAAGVVTAKAGAVTQVPLRDVPGGLYSVVVRSDVPVVASAMISRASGGSATAGTSADPLGRAAPADYGWAASARPVASARLVAVPGEVKLGDGTTLSIRSTVSLTAAGPGGRLRFRSISPRGVLGEPETATVRAGSTTSFTVDAAAGYLIEPLDPGRVTVAVVASVATQPSALISVWPIVDELAGNAGASMVSWSPKG